MKACMVAYTYYEADNRVRRYAELLAKRGHRVDAVVLRQNGQSSYEELNGVHIYRIQMRVMNEKQPITYFAKLLVFLIKSAMFLTSKSMNGKYDLIHVHSVPDFEVFAALIPKMLGSKLILDIHDIVPEFYASKFHKGSDSVIFKLLAVMEKMSIAFSDHVIMRTTSGRRLLHRGPFVKTSVR